MKREEDTEKLKKQLLNEVQATKSEAQDLVLSGQKIIEDGQRVIDLTEAVENVFKQLPTDSCVSSGELEKQIETWKIAKKGILMAKETLLGANINNPIFLVSTTASTIGSQALFDEFPSQYNRQPFIQAIGKLENVLDKMEWVQLAEEQLIRLSLDTSSSSKQSALSQLRQAKEAFLRPVTSEISPAAILIPIREAINTAIDDLLRRRPFQEEAKNRFKKIISIGTQCGKMHLPPNQLEVLAKQAETIMDELSSAKTDKMNREKVRMLFRNACTFLTAFLEVIDEVSLR